MAYYKIEAVPHFTTKLPAAIEEAKRELLQEYKDFLRFILTTQESLTMHLRSLPGEGEGNAASIEVGYEFGNDDNDLEAYLRTLRRYLRLKQKAEPQRELPELGKLKRRVQLVVVGNLEKMSDPQLSLINLDVQRFTKWDPNVTVGSNLFSVLAYPLTVLVSGLAIDLSKPLTSAFLAPIPQNIVSNVDSSRWRNTLAALMQNEGCITIKCRRYSYKDDDTAFAFACLQYYLGTNIGKLSEAEINKNTVILKTVLSNEPIYTVEFEFYGHSKLLPLSFVRDTDPEAFENTPTQLEQKLINSPTRSKQAATTSWSRGALKPLEPLEPPQSKQKPEGAEGDNNPIRRYADYFLLDEVVDLIMPPYTFHDALPGIRHFVPKPFQEPFLESVEEGKSIYLGDLDEGTKVRIPVKDLTRHTFITGATGAGKSNTMMNIVQQLHLQNIPVLIIDPVKRDFEPLMESLGLQNHIFDFRKQWLRFNPFIPADNITLYAHSVILAKTLSMLFPTNAIAYEILLSMVKETYWQKLSEYRSDPLSTEIFVQKTGRDLRVNPRLAPTFEEFLEIGLNMLKKPSGSGKLSQWTQDAIEHFERRWAGLRRSVFSLMLSPSKPYQIIDDLFSSTYLLEFTSWFDQNEANAAFALVFSMMYEQRLSDFEKGIKDRVCVALLDEAHRIVPAHLGGSDERLVSAAKEASMLFSQMIAECRALGQGIIVGEQSASKIEPNVLINTSTKIVHTVLYGKDKEFLSSALALSPSEQDYLAYLQRGEALVFNSDIYQPLFVHIPKFGKLAKDVERQII